LILLSSCEAKVFKKAFVQAPLDGDGARRVLAEHHERVHIRGADPGEAQGAGVLTQVDSKCAVSGSSQERVGEYLRVYVFDGLLEFVGEFCLPLKVSLGHNLLPYGLAILYKLRRALPYCSIQST